MKPTWRLQVRWFIFRYVDKAERKLRKYHQRMMMKLLADSRGYEWEEDK